MDTERSQFLTCPTLTSSSFYSIPKAVCSWLQYCADARKVNMNVSRVRIGVHFKLVGMILYSGILQSSKNPFCHGTYMSIVHLCIATSKHGITLLTYCMVRTTQDIWCSFWGYSSLKLISLFEKFEKLLKSLPAFEKLPCTGYNA